MLTDIATVDALMPSEIVLLSAARFLPASGPLDRYRVLGSEQGVSKRRLVELMYAVGLLAAEADGEIRLMLRPKKALLGLRTVPALYVEQAGGCGGAPDASLEGALCALFQKLSARKGPCEVEALVYAFLRQDVADPYAAAIDAVYTRMARRHLLETIEDTKLKVFIVRRYVLPPKTASLASEGGQRVASLLQACREARPELWRMLLMQIDAGVRRRTRNDEVASAA
jgi:hypothetical protein